MSSNNILLEEMDLQPYQYHVLKITFSIDANAFYLMHVEDCGDATEAIEEVGGIDKIKEFLLKHRHAAFDE